MQDTAKKVGLAVAGAALVLGGAALFARATSAANDDDDDDDAKPSWLADQWLKLTNIDSWRAKRSAARERRRHAALLRAVETVYCDVSVRVAKFEKAAKAFTPPPPQPQPQEAPSREEAGGEHVHAPAAKHADGGGDAGAAGAAAASAAAESPTGLAGGYYHFDSKGNKLKNKWDSFDVDAALKEVDNQPAGTKLAKPKPQPQPAPKSAPAQPQSGPALARDAAGLVSRLEALLTYIDRLRGPEGSPVRASRRRLAAATNALLARVDGARGRVKEKERQAAGGSGGATVRAEG